MSTKQTPPRNQSRDSLFDFNALRDFSLDASDMQAKYTTPGVDGTSSNVVPSILLEIFARHGQPDLGEREPPWHLTLWFDLVLRRGQARPVDIPDVMFNGPDTRIVAMEFPALEAMGWRHPVEPASEDLFDQFKEALEKAGSIRVETPGLLVAPVNVVTKPKTPDGLVVVQVNTFGAGNGARIDVDRLSYYARQSAPLYRGFLASAHVLFAHERRAGRAANIKPTEFTADELVRTLQYQDTNPRQAKANSIDVYEKLATDGAIDFHERHGRFTIEHPST